MKGIGHGEKLSRKQEQAIAGLLQQPTLSKAAKVAGIGEATLWRWLQQPGFKELYQEARRQTVGHAICQLQQASSEAVSTLRVIMADVNAPASSRVAAARATLELALRGVELEDLTARVEALEKLLDRGVS